MKTLLTLMSISSIIVMIQCDLNQNEVTSLSNFEIDNVVEKKIGDYLISVSDLSDKNSTDKDIELSLSFMNLKYHSNPLLLNDQSASSFDEKIYYCSYLFEKQVLVKRKNSFYKPVLCVFQRSYEISNQLQFNIVFPLESIEVGDQLVINDRLFGQGTIKMSLK